MNLEVLQIPDITNPIIATSIDHRKQQIGGELTEFALDISRNTFSS